MRKRLLAVIGSLVGVAVFSVTLWVLQRELREFRYHDIVRQLHNLPRGRVFLALLFTALNYWVLTGYDALALHYLKRPLAYRRILLASFTSYSFSNNVGLSVFGSSAVRYRLYSMWGLSSLEIATVVAFSALTMWLGVHTLASVLFLVHPPMVPTALPLPLSSFRPVGVLFLLLVVGYLVVGAVRRRPLRLRGWEVRVPPLPIRLLQVGLGSLDWTLAGAALYVLLPPAAAVSAFTFLGVFLAAEVVALFSHVPGGLAVFETVFLLLLRPYLPAPAVLGSLVAFRGIYYLLPLVVGALVLATHEVAVRKEAGKRAILSFAGWASPAVPHFLSIIAFLGGLVLLFSGATPAIPQRLVWLSRFLPLPLLELSHFLGSLAGAGLILVAHGLQRRIDAAYYLTVVLLAAGAVFSLVKGLDYEEAVILSVMLAALIPCRKEFYRKASLFSARFTPGWSAAVVLLLVTTVWLGLFAHRHVSYSRELWWRFSLEKGDASRALRATAGAVSLSFLFAVAKLLRPRPPRPARPTQAELNVVREIAERSPATLAYLALLGDKSFLLNEERTAFLMYAVHRPSWIALGDPVGPEGEWRGLAWRFRELADTYAGRTVFHSVGLEGLPLYVDLGLTLLKIGEEARVPLGAFDLGGVSRKSLRHNHRRVQEEGCTFAILPAEQVSPLLGELRAVSDAWLADKHTQEKGFSLGFFTEEYIRLFPAALVRKAGQILAFANVWLGGDKGELPPTSCAIAPRHRRG